ncbi:MAG: hypothetical protein JNL90_08195 [Planctomycetes bacterium]|nr:hypothetical protein [Planctomycetota bacterium]
MAARPLATRCSPLRRLALVAGCALLLLAAAGRDDAVTAIKTLVEQRRFLEAAQAGEKLVKERAEDAEAWLLLAQVHLSPDWAFRRDARAASAATRAMKLAGRRPDIVAALAFARARLTEYDDALKLIGELCDATPPKASGELLSELLVLRAELRLKREGAAGHAAALADLERAIVAAPRASQPRILRAEAWMNVDRYADALEDLKVAIDRAPGSKAAHALLRTACSQLGQREEARRHYEIWKRLNRLTDSVAPTSAPDLLERRDVLRELATLNPRDLDRRLELAQTELQLADYDGALATCEALLGVAPTFAAARWIREQALLAKAGQRPPPPVPAPASDGDGDGAGDGASESASDHGGGAR